MDADMERPGVDPNPGRLIENYLSTADAGLNAEFDRLVAAVWNRHGLTDHATAVALGLAGHFATLDRRRQGQVAILLGLLIEAAQADTRAALVELVTRDLSSYLDAWRLVPATEPLSLALLYLLSHLPDERARIAAVAQTISLDPDDRARLARALSHLDPECPDLGRVFPSPAVWTLSDEEREHDAAWVRALPPAKVVENWVNDTRTVLGHLGAKSYWAVRHQSPVRIVASPVQPLPEAPATGGEPGPELFRQSASAFRCPDCACPLEFGEPVRCTGCGTEYPLRQGILDLSRSVPSQVGVEADLLMKLSEMPSMGHFYEAKARPAFLRLSGSNWGGVVTPEDERAYVATHTRPVEGPVLDLAAGAGTWTAMLAEVVGPERVIALDMALPMLTALRRRLPRVPATRANAQDLPFAEESLGAVNCWNALQAFPGEAAAALTEIGRCLRPGGSLTLLTFRNSPDPVYRYFVGAHHFPQHQAGLRLFDLDQLLGWLERAGLQVTHESYPGTFVFITATKTG